MSVGQRVLVTGGAGCIGLEVCNQLAAQGTDVRLFDLPEQIARVQQAIAPGVGIRYGSILDASSLRDAMQDCHGVVHLAAHLGVRRTEINRLRCLEVNIGGTKQVLDCAVQHRVRKVVFASSSEVYGEPATNPVSEHAPTQGKSVYAVSKLAGEEFCTAYHQRYPELHYAILRYFNTYGPYQTAQFVIPRFVLNVMTGLAPIVHGTGQQKRSYSYVADVARATITALETDAANGQIINIGNSQQPVTLLELAELVIDLGQKRGVLQPELRADFRGADRDGEREVFVRYGDLSKAQHLLGYSSSISLEEGIRRLFDSRAIFARWETTELPYLQDELT